MNCRDCKRKITLRRWLHVGNICPRCKQLKWIEENTSDVQVRRFKRNALRNKKESIQ